MRHHTAAFLVVIALASIFQVDQLLAVPAISVANHLVTGVINPNGSPGAIKTTFLATDVRVCSFVTFTGTTGSQQLVWKYINPRNGVQMQSSLQLGQRIRSAWSCLSIAGKPAGRLPGAWSIQFWIDGVQKFSDPFTLTQANNLGPTALQVVRHQMARDVIKSPCCTPVVATTFSPTDPRAILFVEISGAFQQQRLRWEFYGSQGLLYATHEAAAQYKYQWAWINISGRSAAFMPGQWTAKFFIDNQLQFQENFTITTTAATAATTRSYKKLDVELKALGKSFSRFVLRTAIPESQYTRLEIFDIRGKLLFDSHFLRASAIFWAAQDSAGRPLPNGIYFYRVIIQNPDGQLEHSLIKKLKLLR